MGQIWPRNSRALFRMKIRTKRYSQVLILNLTNVFLSSVPKISFWANFVSKSQSTLFKMKLGTRGYSKLLILSSRIVHINSVPTIHFWAILVTKIQNALFRMKLGTKEEYSGVLILNSTIAFSNSVPRITSFGKKRFHFKQSSLKFRGPICAKRYFREGIYKNNC